MARPTIFMSGRSGPMPAAELPPPSQFIEHIADNRGKQFVAQAGEQGIIVHLGHILLLGLART